MILIEWLPIFISAALQPHTWIGTVYEEDSLCLLCHQHSPTYSQQVKCAHQEQEEQVMAATHPSHHHTTSLLARTYHHHHPDWATIAHQSPYLIPSRIHPTLIIYNDTTSSSSSSSSSYSVTTSSSISSITTALRVVHLSYLFVVSICVIQVDNAHH